MENVKGILTKDKGRFVDRILSEIRSILDEWQLPALYDYIRSTLPSCVSPFLVKAVLTKLEMEAESDSIAEKKYEEFFALLEEQLKTITQGMKYKVSKSDKDINTIRHGILLLKDRKEREQITRLIVNLKAHCNVNNDHLTDKLNDSISAIDDETLIAKINESLVEAKKLSTEHKTVDDMAYALQIFAMSFDECINEIGKIIKEKKDKKEVEIFFALVESVRLYQIERPIIVLSADYGVPQNRERVLFIGCRKDQELITEIPATISKDGKVALFEALWDMDMIGNGEIVTNYRTIVPQAKYQQLLRSRSVFSEPNEYGRMYSDWSKCGRLGHRFKFESEPFYVKTAEELKDPYKHQHMGLFNHQTSLKRPMYVAVCKLLRSTKTMMQPKTN